jgi:excisionase family DNA binding protein
LVAVASGFYRLGQDVHDLVFKAQFFDLEREALRRACQWRSRTREGAARAPPRFRCCRYTVRWEFNQGGEQIEVPEEVLQVPLRTVHEQAAGRRGRGIAPNADDELTPNQAAVYLGISRPLLAKLLDGGTVSAHTLPSSRHRRIAVAELEAYQTRKSRRRGHLAKAMNEVADTGLYLPQP